MANPNLEIKVDLSPLDEHIILNARLDLLERSLSRMIRRRKRALRSLRKIGPWRYFLTPWLVLDRAMEYWFEVTLYKSAGMAYLKVVRTLTESPKPKPGLHRRTS